MAFALTVLRVTLVALVWFLLAMVGGWANRGLHAMMIEPAGSATLLVGTLVFLGLVFAAYVFDIRLRVGLVNQAVPTPRRKATAEPETLRLRDMIALLDDDDLADLRAEVREGLRDRIRNLTADESESFETLLSDAGAKRKR